MFITNNYLKNILIKVTLEEAIFIMIAGSFTAPLYIYTKGILFWGILLPVWILSLSGMYFKISHLNIPRSINFLIYTSITMISIIPITILWNATQFIQGTILPMIIIKGFLILGLCLYCIGGLFYFLKEPEFMPKKIGFHGIFHSFVLLGAFMHFLALYFSIKSYPAIQVWALKNI